MPSRRNAPVLAVTGGPAWSAGHGGADPARRARRLEEIDALKQGLDVPAATDILWFYFGYASYFTLTEENKWTLRQAEQWLFERACIGTSAMPARPSRSAGVCSPRPARTKSTGSAASSSR
ncbi:hypothetical protein [Streptomyces sp. NPDC050287]|uniref:hypothetical protein n=1 Tax=Streptomyces sp. NPDC050287 TaxID=3365608 RepID=UPI00378A9A77